MTWWTSKALIWNDSHFSTLRIFWSLGFVLLHLNCGSWFKHGSRLVFSTVLKIGRLSFVKSPYCTVFMSGQVHGLSQLNIIFSYAFKRWTWNGRIMNRLNILSCSQVYCSKSTSCVCVCVCVCLRSNEPKRMDLWCNIYETTLIKMRKGKKIILV
jgi:hypothetical protein